jgi:pimeloyl-ACP methyl ester carboxylesterase
VRLLLIPSFTELEWGIRPLLEEWAEVATFDMPGVGDEPLPADIELDPEQASQMLSRWREAGAKRGLEEVERRGWERFVVVNDGYGAPTACRLARQLPESVLGLAIGHASLSHATEGERAPVQGAVWAALGQLTKQGNEAFVRYGIAQMTRGGISEELAQEMLARFPDMELVAAVVEALGREPEPIGEDLQALGAPLLLAKHEGCLGRTDEGFEDIVGAFPDAQTAICPEACPSSPAFADALRRFCNEHLVSRDAPPDG